MDVQSQVLHKTSHDQSHVLSQLLGSIVNDSIEVVDMTQVLNEDTPVIQLPEPFKNTGGFQFKQLSKYDETGPVCYWNDFVAGEHCGTHFDAPNHWVTGRENASVDKIPVKNLIGEARVINIKKSV